MKPQTVLNSELIKRQKIIIGIVFSCTLIIMLNTVLVLNVDRSVKNEEQRIFSEGFHAGCSVGSHAAKILGLKEETYRLHINTALEKELINLQIKK